MIPRDKSNIRMIINKIQILFNNLPKVIKNNTWHAPKLGLVFHPGRPDNSQLLQMFGIDPNQ